MKKIGFRQSRNSIEDYVRWRKEKIKDAIQKVNRLTNLKDAKVLDVGCGFGPLSEILLGEGCVVRATEIDEDKLVFARKYFKKNKNIQLLKVEDEILPYSDNEFDVVFLFDVIEHTKNPGKMLEEAVRVLKNKGVLYVCFGPYYSVSGHHLYDYAKWPIHILPKNIIKRFVYSKKKTGYFNNDYFWKQFESLNKLRIGDFQKMVGGLKKVDERFIFKYPELFEVNLGFSNYLGYFKDTLAMSFEGIYINTKS